MAHFVVKSPPKGGGYARTFKNRFDGESCAVVGGSTGPKKEILGRKEARGRVATRGQETGLA